MTHCILIGAPVDSGQQRPGCLMGPAAYRVARLPQTLAALGHTVEDLGDLFGLDLEDDERAGLLATVPSRPPASSSPRVDETPSGGPPASVMPSPTGPT